MIMEWVKFLTVKGVVLIVYVNVVVVIEFPKLWEFL